MMPIISSPYWMGADGVAYYPGTTTGEGAVVDCQPGILWNAGMVRVLSSSVADAVKHGWHHLSDDADGWSKISRRAPMGTYHGRRIA